MIRALEPLGNAAVAGALFSLAAKMLFSRYCGYPSFLGSQGV